MILPHHNQTSTSQPHHTLGTDFGTSKLTQVIGTNQKFDLVPHSGSPYLPMALFLVDRETGEVLIGDPAFNAAIKDPSALYVKFKRSYLTDGPNVRLNGNGLTPLEAMELFVRKLVESLRHSAPWIDDPNHVVKSAVAYPTGLTLSQQEELRQLFQRAGLPVTTLVPEAVAAALTFLDTGCPFLGKPTVKCHTGQSVETPTMGRSQLRPPRRR